MLSLEQIAVGYMKNRLREEFMQAVVDRLDPTGDATDFSEYSDKAVADFDFDSVFCQVLYNNGVRPSDFGIDLFDFVIWDEADKANDKYMKFVRSILCAFNRNNALYMKFLEFVVKRNHGLARMVFRHPDFDVAYCLNYNEFSLQDFKRIAAWDLEIGADIFRNNGCPVLWYACSHVLIEDHAFEKIKHLVQTHGPDIMLWISNQDDHTNVNGFLKRGNIMNTEPRFRMQEKLDFMINCCPRALKKYTIRQNSKENAFTIVLDRCNDDANPRHHEIVRNVFQHLGLSDLHTVYSGHALTLLDLVKSSTNAVVAQYLERRFGLDLRYGV